MKISFNQIWVTVITPLKGSTVSTLDENKLNKIVDVTATFLKRVSENNSKPQTINREVFEEIYDRIMETGEMSRVEINQKYPKRYSSIICAIMAKASNIGYRLPPLKLFRKNDL